MLCNVLCYIIQTFHTQYHNADVVICKINVLVEFSHAIVTMHTKVYKLTSGVP